MQIILCWVQAIFYTWKRSGHVQKLTSFSGPEEIIIIINSWYKQWEAVLKKIVIEGV